MAGDRMVAVAGSSGFIGAHVTADLERLGHEVRQIPSFRVTRDDVRGDAHWERRREELASLLVGVECVVNCAGMASPRSRDQDALVLANHFAAKLLWEAADVADCRRFVQVSSAAVQGRRPVLDETGDVSPVSPYGWSKAVAEIHLLGQKSGPDVFVYRGPSVQGSGRSTTSQIGRYLRLPVVPITNGGSNRIPLALVENAAHAISHIVGSSTLRPGIALHPWEGVTLEVLLAMVPSRRIELPVPGVIADRTIQAASLVLGGTGYAALVRQAELLLIGQEQDARALSDDGFVLPLDLEIYHGVFG